MIEAMKDGEDVEDWIARYEAYILRRERYTTDAQYKRDVEWWMFYTRNGCDTLRHLLQRPDHADRYEKIRALLEKRMARLKKLEHILSEGKEDMKQMVAQV